MTGEWIIYAEHESQKFYLCLAKHNDGDETIRERIGRVCVREFPFLRDVLRVGNLSSSISHAKRASKHAAPHSSQTTR